MNRYAAAYLRRSSADEDNPGDVSREAQEDAIRALAARDAPCELRMFVDWGRSADEAKEAQRAEYGRMLAAIERGEVSTIYAYALDRLARSTVSFGKLLKATKERNVRIVTAREGDLSDTGNLSSWSLGFLTSFFAEYELRTSKARNAAIRKRRTERGDEMRKAPFGKRIARDEYGVAYKPIRWEDDPDRPVQALIDAYREAGTVLGACKLLNERHVPTRHRGSRAWSPTSLTNILERESVLPPRGRRTYHGRSEALFAGMIRCHCGRGMTPDVSTNGYYCANGKVIGSAMHGKTWVAEHAVLPALIDEVARLRTPKVIETQTSDEERRQQLTGKRARWIEMYAEGVIDKAERDRRLADIDAALAKLEARRELVPIKAIDWTWPVEDLNPLLRELYVVHLDTEMKPTIEWRVPEFRDAAPVGTVRIQDLPAHQQAALLAKMNASRHTAARAATEK